MVMGEVTLSLVTVDELYSGRKWYTRKTGTAKDSSIVIYSE